MVAATAISSVEERMHHSFGGVDGFAAAAATGIRCVAVVDYEFGVGRTTEEEVFQEAFAG